MEHEYMIPETVTQRLEERIEHGMKFLDDYFGTKEWVNEIDIKRLEMNDGNHCICGQLFDPQGNKLFAGQDAKVDGYEYVLEHVIEHNGSDPKDTYDETTYDKRRQLWWKASEYGFNLITEHDDEDDIDEEIAVLNGYDEDDESTWVIYDEVPTAWHVLQDLWIEKLEKRKAEMGTMA